MLKKLVLLTILLTLPVLSVWAQDGGDESDPLAAIVLAYQDTAAIDKYRVAASEETVQSVSFLTFSSSVFAMDVDIYEAFVIDLIIETDTSAEIEGDDIGATMAVNVEQVQGRGLLYILRDEVIQRPEDQESEIELNAQMRLFRDTLYVNVDETDEEYRQGVPEGWQVATGDTPVLTDAQVSMDDLNAILQNTRLDADRVVGILVADAVATVDLVGEEDGLQHYSVQFDAPTALALLGIDLDALVRRVVSEQALQGELTPTYTLEVWIGADDGLVHQHVVTLGLNGDLTNDDSGRVLYRYQQVVTLELSDFNAADINVLPPPTTEILG